MFFLLIVKLLLSHWWWHQKNPGSKRRIFSYFSSCLSLRSASNTIRKCGICCISESYLNSTADNNVLLIDGNNLIRADHLNSQKKGGVCMYFKEQLNLRQINTTYFSECSSF